MGDAYRIYDNLTPQVTHISLCSGYGGIDIGLKRAIPNLLTIAYAEIEAFACANLVAKMEEGYLDAAPIFSNLKTFPWEDFRGVVDIVSGGFPCQPFSQAGKRNADTDERHLFPYILEGIRKCRPPLVYLENVEGIISAKLTGDGWRDPEGTPVLLHVLRELERVGYKATAGVFSASEVGAPHQRKRVFIMGYSKHNGLLTLTKLRGNEETSDYWRQKKQEETRQPEGTSRPIDVSGLSGCEFGSELGNTESIGTLRQRSSRLKESYSSAKKGLSISSNEAMGDSYSNGSRQSRLLRKGTDGSVTISDGETRGTLWSSRPGQPQYWWEPPRVVAMENTNSTRGRGKGGDTLHQGRTTSQGGSEGISQDSEGRDGIAITDNQSASGDRNKATINEIKSEMGGNIDGPSSGMVYAELCQSCDSRNDELRLLGNGVVPQTCTKAFVTLLQRLIDG